MATFPTASRAVALAGAWTKISNQQLSAPAASIVLSGLDTANKVFRLHASIVKDGTGSAGRVRLNNDSGANYDRQQVSGNGVTVGGSRSTGQTSIINVPNHADANENASADILIAKQQTGDEAMLISQSVGIDTSIRFFAVAGIWHNVADLINRIDLTAVSGNWAADTIVTLEGDQTT